MADIFVSHSEQDRGVAQTLAKLLGDWAGRSPGTRHR